MIPNTNKIKSHQKHGTSKIGKDMIMKTDAIEKLSQQSSIAFLKPRNPSNLVNIFAAQGQYVDFQLSSDFNKIDKIDDIVLWMEISCLCNQYQSSVNNFHYIAPAVLIDSKWLIDRVEFSVSGSLFDIQRPQNFLLENSYKSNDELIIESEGGGYNKNYLEFTDNDNSIIFPTNTPYTPSASAPSVEQKTKVVSRTLRLGRNLLNKILLKACNDPIVIRVYFNINNNIVVGSPVATFSSIKLTSSLLYLQGIKYSPIELSKQLMSKYEGKEYQFTYLARKWNTINFDNVKQGIRQSADIGNFAGTFSTFGCYLNYQNPRGEEYNQNKITSSPVQYRDLPEGSLVFDAYRVLSVPISNGLPYIVNKGSTYIDSTNAAVNNITNPHYSATHEIFEMNVTLQDGLGDAYPYTRNISDLIMKNFSANKNNSDFIKSYSIYPFNFGGNSNKNYWDQNIQDGHYVFDNSSELIFEPTHPNVPSSVQLTVVGTQLCQGSVKGGRIFFKYL